MKKQIKYSTDFEFVFLFLFLPLLHEHTQFFNLLSNSMHTNTYSEEYYGKVDLKALKKMGY